jgi:hypothetical protein
MNRRIILVVMLVGMGLGLWTAVAPLGAVRLPGNNRLYEPQQPIAYSHRLHAGELGINCLYCHGAAEHSRRAGVPAASTCMNCHKFVTSTLTAKHAEDALAQKEHRSPNRIISPELAKLYNALGLNEQMQVDPKRPQHPIQWTRIHRLPSFVTFDHSRHVNAGVTCQTCHGEIQTMERVRQIPDLTMGWCVNCHRDVNVNGVAGKPVNASTDCISCHQ